MKATPPDKLEKHICPICKKEVVKDSFFNRYPNYVCRECEKRAVNREGFPVAFGNTSMSGGFIARYKNKEGQFVESEDPTCFIDGVECWAEEARFGGIVLRPAVC